jgi:hypothetical protein
MYIQTYHIFTEEMGVEKEVLSAATITAGNMHTNEFILIYVYEYIIYA